MMLLIKTISLLMIVFMIIIFSIIAMPYNDSSIQQFMTSTENCGGACLLGIQPGATTVGEAMQHLSNHTWISDLRLNAPGNGFAQITWEWSGQQPNVIDDSKRGRITFYWIEEDTRIELNSSILETVTVYTRIRIYSLYTFLGETQMGTALIRPDGQLGYSVIYDMPRGNILILSSEMSCPVNMQTYWHARTRLLLSVGYGSHEFVSVADVVNLC